MEFPLPAVERADLCGVVHQSENIRNHIAVKAAAKTHKHVGNVSALHFIH